MVRTSPVIIVVVDVKYAEPLDASIGAKDEFIPCTRCVKKGIQYAEECKEGEDPPILSTVRGSDAILKPV